jgi:hypothetical protein
MNTKIKPFTPAFDPIKSLSDQGVKDEKLLGPLRGKKRNVSTDDERELPKSSTRESRNCRISWTDKNRRKVDNEKNTSGNLEHRILQNSNTIPEESKMKRRRYQRRNSATAAMMFSQMYTPVPSQRQYLNQDNIATYIAGSVMYENTMGGNGTLNKEKKSANPSDLLRMSVKE